MCIRDRLHGHHIGDQKHVGLRLAGLDLGMQLGQDLRRAVAHPIDLDAGILRHEGVDGLLGIGIRPVSYTHLLEAD